MVVFAEAKKLKLCILTLVISELIRFSYSMTSEVWGVTPS
ncbi:hypothetical protein B6N60_01832 [Richelia sinica FACHB-800]|uniref:Uncharacterized protein n=1 Tax=Richelia sinica FACHB-800 TaxID=1357546 RepID=A0A975Y4G3_9NOST|nr:hypothetical protein B6N60_01832 [Richelia sinica FACHB-800]